MPLCPHCHQTHNDNVDYCPRTGLAVRDVEERMTGRILVGKYKLLKCIGRGGMGAVFEAEHITMGGKFALKVLKVQNSGKKKPVERLYREARVTAAIGHPNIIQVFDIDETSEGVPFMVMELLKGVSLGDYLKNNGPLSVGFVLDVGIQILSALHAAHRTGVIHRDMKCDNVFLLDSEQDGNPHVKILDFGVSKYINTDSEDLKLTQTGSVLGTPYYMSPEQASGKKNLDNRVDIYALGVMLYELLTGTVPHEATNYNSLVIAKNTCDVQSFRQERPDVSPDLEAVVLKALARHRKWRWRNALDMMEALVHIRDEMTAAQLSAPPVYAGNRLRTASDALETSCTGMGFPSITSMDPATAPISLAHHPVSTETATSEIPLDTGSLPQRSLLRPALSIGAFLIVLFALIAFFYQINPVDVEDLAAPSSSSDSAPNLNTSIGDVINLDVTAPSSVTADVEKDSPAASAVGTVFQTDKKRQARKTSSRSKKKGQPEQMSDVGSGKPVDGIETEESVFAHGEMEDNATTDSGQQSLEQLMDNPF